MNKTQKALWFSGMFAAILTAVLISMINDARGKLDQSVLDNVRQDSEIKHMANNYDAIKLELRDISVSQDTLIKVVTRSKNTKNKAFQTRVPGTLLYR